MTTDKTPKMARLHSFRMVCVRVAQCIDKEILIAENCNIDLGIDIDKEKFEKLTRY